MDKSNNMDRSERIDRYVKGNLDSEELQQFRTEMQQDNTLQQEVEDTQITQALLQHQGLKNELIIKIEHPPPSGGQVVSDDRLGGLLKSYRRAA